MQGCGVVNAAFRLLYFLLESTHLSRTPHHFASGASYRFQQLATMIGRDVLGQIFKTAADPPILFAIFLHETVPHQILKFFVGPQPKHFFATSHRIAFPQSRVHLQK